MLKVLFEIPSVFRISKGFMAIGVLAAEISAGWQPPNGLPVTERLSDRLSNAGKEIGRFPVVEGRPELTSSVGALV
jgi:hypothetical protein